MVFDYRRLGKETGFDTVIHLDNNLRQARQYMQEIAYRPSRQLSRSRATSGIWVCSVSRP